MARPLDIDARARAVLLRRAGGTCAEVGEQLLIAPSTVWKLEKLADETGSLAPCKTGGRRKRILEERGVEAGVAAVRQFIRSLGREERREERKESQGEQDPDRLVFLDGTGIKTSMAPIRGWALKGERPRGRRRSGAGTRRPWSPRCGSSRLAART